MLAGPRRPRCSITETDERPARRLAPRPSTWCPTATTAAAGQGARHPRPDRSRLRPLRRGAGRSALEALALAERLDLHELVSDVVTTLSQARRRPARRRGCAPRWTTRRRGPAQPARVHAELRGRFLLGRSYQDWAEFDEAEALVPQRASTAAPRPGIPWAPYAFESRWQLAWSQLRRAATGTRRSTLTDVARPAAAADPAGAARARRGCRSSPARGERRRPTGCPALRRFWAARGRVAIHAGAARDRSTPARRGDPAAALGVVRRRGRASSAGSGTSGSAPGSGWRRSTIGALADAAAAAQRRRARRRTSPSVERLHADGHTVLDTLRRPVRPLGARGPGLGEAARRRDAAGALAGRHRRARRRTRWSTPGARPSSCSRTSAHVHELAAVARRAGRRSCAPTGDTAGAREVGDLAREAAHRLGAQPLLDELRALGSAPGPRRRPAPRHPHRRARPRSWRWSPRAAPTARSASSCSSAPRPCRSTSPTSSASSAPPAAPRPPRSPAAAACSTDALGQPARGRRVRPDGRGWVLAPDRTRTDPTTTRRTP